MKNWSTDLIPRPKPLSLQYMIYDSQKHPLVILPDIPAGQNAVWGWDITLPKAAIAGRDSYDAWNANAHTLYFAQEVVPEPGSFLILGSGLAGLIGFVRRRRP